MHWTCLIVLMIFTKMSLCKPRTEFSSNDEFASYLKEELKFYTSIFAKQSLIGSVSKEVIVRTVVLNILVVSSNIIIPEEFA